MDGFDMDAAAAGDAAKAVRRGYDGSGPNPMDAALRVRFFTEAVENPDMTKRGFDMEGDKKVRCRCGSDLDERDPRYFVKLEDARKAREAEGIHHPGGRPIYEDVIMVEIHIPGDSTMKVRQQAWIDASAPNSHVNRFPRQWKHFQDGQKGELVIGTPLGELIKSGLLRPSQVKEYGHFDCKTVEQLAAMSDMVGQKFMGFHGHKAAAVRYLAEAKADAPMQLLRSEKADREAEIATLREQLKQLGDRLSAKGLDSRPPAVEGASKAYLADVAHEAVQQEAARQAEKEFAAKGIKRGPGRPRKDVPA